MKKAIHLFLLLVVIALQGAWAQETVAPGQKLKLGENRISIPSFSSAYSYSTSSSSYNLYEFVAPATGTFGIYSVSAFMDKAFAMFDANGNYLADSQSYGNGYYCPTELEGGKTYYLGMRARDAYKAQTAYYNVEFTCKNHANTELVPGTVTCTKAGTVEYLYCNVCHGCYSTDDEHSRLSEWDINKEALGHDIVNGLCTRCGEDFGLAIGEKTVHLAAGNYARTAFQYTATETGTIKISAVTDAEINSVYLTPWDSYANPPASAPRKSAAAGDASDPYEIKTFVEAGKTYAIVFVTNSDEESEAKINLDYYSILIEGTNVDLAKALADHPDAKGFSFDSWSYVKACTVTRDITLELGNVNIKGQLKIDNGAKVVLDGSNGNIDFSDGDNGKFAIEVLNGDVTFFGSNLFSGDFGGGVLLKKGSFTSNGGRIRAYEAVVARKSLGSTDDVTINILDGAEVWGSKVAIYMDVNGHLTIDNPGTYQGIQGDTQSIVVKAGTFDLSNVEQYYAIRNNGPVGAVEDRPEPVMHGRIPYIYGVPAVAMQVGTAEEGFTGTTTLRMRNVCLPESSYGDVDYQLVLITGSAAHPTRYQMANVQNKEQIVVENEEFVELLEPVVVNDGENSNVNLVSGTAQETVLKYTATDSRVLEVSATTDATIVDCAIIPWEEWDGVSEDSNNDDMQYARRKANRIGGNDPADNIIASKKVIAGNSYAIVFRTTTTEETTATITLEYTEVIYSEVFVGENDITIESTEGNADDDSNHYNIFKFIAPASGQAHIYTKADYSTIGKLFDSSMFSIQDSHDYDSYNYNYNLKIDYDVVEGKTYYIGVRMAYGNETIACPLVVEIEGYNPPVFIEEGTNNLTFKESASNVLYGDYYYSYVPQESGYVTISCNDAYYMYVKNNDNYIAETAEGETTFSFVASGNTTYTVFVTPNTGVKSAVLNVSREAIAIVTTLSLGNNWVEIAGNDSEGWHPESTDFYALFPFTPDKDGVLTVESKGDEDTMGALFDAEGNFLKSGDDEGDDYNFSLSSVVEGGKPYYIGVREYDGNPLPLYLVSVSLKDLPQISKTLELSSEDGTELELDTALENYLGEDNSETIFSANGVTYKRAETTSKWGTVVLPYELESNDNVAYYELTVADIPSGTLEFAKVDRVKANTPTVYRLLSGNQYDASVDGPVTIEVPYDTWVWTETRAEGWVLDGWYYAATFDAQEYCDENEGYMYISGDKFWHATGILNMRPYRACFYTWNTVWSDAPAKAMTISFKDDDGTVTVIESVMEDNGEFTDVDAVYSIDGQRLNSIQRGVNILRTADGKTRKFIKK